MTSQYSYTEHGYLTHMLMLFFHPLKWAPVILYFMRIEGHYATECPLTVSETYLGNNLGSQPWEVNKSQLFVRGMAAVSQSESFEAIFSQW